MALFWNHKKKKKYITADRVQQMLGEGGALVILDLRLGSEFRTKGRVPGAVNISVEKLEKQAPQKLPEKSCPIVIYCETGEKTDVAADILLSMGYETVYILGGIHQWKYDLDWKPVPEGTE